MFKITLLICVLIVSGTSAFAPSNSRTFSSQLNAGKRAPKQKSDPTGNNIAVKELLEQVQDLQLLTKVAEAGILSKAQDAGISLSKLEPLLKLASSNNDILIIAEAAAPEALPLLPKIVSLTPAALPLLTVLVQTPPAALLVGAVLSLASAGAGVYFIPDDTIPLVAAQTLLVATLGVLAPATLGIGSIALGKAKN